MAGFSPDDTDTLPTRLGESQGHSSAVRDWIARFAAALEAPENARWDEVFADECYWRDFVALSWTIVTLHGRDAIGDMARAQAPQVRPQNIALDDPNLPTTDENNAWFTFSTQTARCRGFVTLTGGRARILMTAMIELIGHEEPFGERRSNGIVHRADRNRKTWLQERQEEERRLGYEEQPYCLIIGGGQNGLQLAARMRRLSVPTIVVDALEKPGDSWRVRYDSLYLHDPIFMDDFPYMPFPDHWPLYTSKDKMGDWLEVYAKTMEINFWGKTFCTSARYDSNTQEWRVTVDRNGQIVELRPKQVVLATGLSGEKFIPHIPGTEKFAGMQYHAADHRHGKGMAGKQVVVVGSNNSAHDICVDMWEGGAEVTMIQRSPTVVVRAETMGAGGRRLPFTDPKISTETADLMMNTMPFKLREQTETEMTQMLEEVDKPFYDRLEKAGFQRWNGEDNTGFLMAYHRLAAGYYIDVGASDLISDGEIKLAHGEIREITEDGVQMEDGTFLPAQVIVYATGYRPMSHMVSQLISHEVADRLGPVWGLGSGTAGDPGPWQGELRNMWKPTPQEGLWIQGGNLMQARFHSLHLALQIKARMEGLPTPVYQPKLAQ